MWEVATSAYFDGWFAALGGEEQSEVIAKVNLLRVFGPQLPRPHADTLNGSLHANMKELRADTGRAVLRIAFAFDPNRRAILLIGGDKAGVNQKRFYRRLIEKADRIYDAHLMRIKAARKSKEK